MKKTGIELITEENKKDIYRKRAAPDMCALMAASYCLPQRARKPQYGEKMWPTHWPVGYAIFDFKPEDRIKELQKAGALIAAEIDRLQAEDSDVQVVDEKIEFSWFPNNGNWKPN